MRKILQKDNPKLRERSREVLPEEIGSPYVEGVIRDMKEKLVVT